MDERRRLERRAARGDREAIRRLASIPDDPKVAELKAAWRERPEDEALQEALLLELGRRGRLWASLVTGDFASATVRLHDGTDSPRGKDWRSRTIREVRSLMGDDGRRRGLDIQSMGPNGALRKVLERLRERYGARSRILELREEWEREGVMLAPTDWAKAARAHAKEQRARGMIGWNPPGRDQLERLARRAAAGDLEAARRLEAELKAREYSVDPEERAEREYLRHVGAVLLARTLLLSTGEWGPEEVDLRRPVRVRVLARREFDGGSCLAPRVERIEDGTVEADWPVELLDRLAPEDVGLAEADRFLLADQHGLYPRGSRGWLWVMADSDKPRDWRRA